MSPAVDVLIPTCHRPAAVAVTLASLAAQDMADWRAATVVGASCPWGGSITRSCRPPSRTAVRTRRKS